VTVNEFAAKPEIVRRPAMTVMGVLVKSTAEEQDFCAFWDRFMARAEEIEPFRIEPGWYGVDYLPDETGVFEYIPGIAVGAVGEVPDGLVVRDVPGGLYAAFACRVSTMQQTYDAIEKWLASAAYAREESRPGLEFYAPPGTEDAVIYVPVRTEGTEQ
jgi:predicted transcriptional regulator YdeE